MNTLFRKFTLILILSFIVSNVFAAKKQKEPAWMSDIHAEYPFNEYIAQIGQGASESEAQNDAVAQIARFIESDVQTTTDSLLTMVLEKDEVIKNSFINVKTAVSSNVKLFQVQHSNSYYDKKAKKYYIVAFINRNDAFELLKPKIDIPSKQIQTYCKTAEEELDILKKGLILNDAINLSKEFIEQYCLVSMINPEAAKIYNSTYKKVLELPAEIKNIFRNCTVSINVENDFNESVCEKMKEIFNNSGFPIVSNNSKYKVKVIVNMDIQNVATGCFYYPSFEATVESENVVGSFGQKGKKISAKSTEVARNRAYKEIENILENAFYSQFLVRK